MNTNYLRIIKFHIRVINIIVKQEMCLGEQVLKHIDINLYHKNMNNLHQIQ